MQPTSKPLTGTPSTVRSAKWIKGEAFNVAKWVGYREDLRSHCNCGNQAYSARCIPNTGQKVQRGYAPAAVLAILRAIITVVWIRVPLHDGNCYTALMHSGSSSFVSPGAFLKKHRFVILSCIVIASAVAAIELCSGRSLLGPDGRFGWWDGDIWSSENSQRVADAYSFSHIIHGMLFYGFLWWVARRLPVKHRFLLALLIEAGWELLENSPLIINRYREATIGQGYFGDSVLNSVCDVGMMALGFLVARFTRVWFVVAMIIVLELGCLWWVRDNLTLNVLMLVHPVQSIKAWQSVGH